MIDRRTLLTMLIAGVATSLCGRSSKAQAQPAVSVRIPVIPATQSGAKLPLNPKEACHPIRTKAAPHRGTPSERSDA